MAEIRVGEYGAAVFAPDGRFTAYLRPGSVVVPILAEDGEPARPRRMGRRDPSHPHYADKVVRPERGPTA